MFPILPEYQGGHESVYREMLWRKYKQTNIVDPRLKPFRTMFDYAKVAVRANGKVSRYVKMGRGLLQCSPLSLLPFNIFIDNLPRILRYKNMLINIGESKINSLIYTDDIVLVSKNRQSLRKCLNTRERHSHRNVYAFAPEKCEVIALVYQVSTGDTTNVLSQISASAVLTHLIVSEYRSL